jgi:hypothetical protein
MYTNKNGKTATIFLVSIIVLLISSTCIGFFLYNKEARLRQRAEDDRNQSQQTEAKLSEDLKEVRRQLVILQDKNKEADEKINNLMDEMELNEGLRKELKTESAAAKEALEAAKKEKEKNLADLQDADRKYKQAMELLRAEQERSADLQKRYKDLEQAKGLAESKIAELKSGLKPYDQRTADEQIASETIKPLSKNGKVELDKIIVNANEGTRGRVLSVDKQTEFLVCSLGIKHGLKAGDLLSVFRGDEYLGDVRVSRVQEEISAADMIPPFSSRKVRKNDIVVFKP